MTYIIFSYIILAAYIKRKLLHGMQLQKEVKSNPAVKEMCSPEEGHCEKRCKIQSGGQEMAVMVG